ncbi:hypothetical protein ACHRVW_10115 [Flavobacterium collinsii]|uniref:hypothetical protein n=1 Tax=Flavobacterium collinsii TaxID=1114861 RepID=UPI0037574FDC
MKGLDFYKKIWHILTIIILSVIALFTIDIIHETKNYVFMDIDFEGKYNSIAAYGALLGGLLSFLSILFVMYQLLEQRVQIITEKQEKDLVLKEELYDILILLRTFMKSSLKKLNSQGEVMKIFYEAEKLEPSALNKMYFLATKDFTRIIDLDSLSIYKGIKLYYGDEEDWEKMYLDIYTYFDFYSESLKEMKEKYNSHTKFKFKKLDIVVEDLKVLLNSCANLIEDSKHLSNSNYLDLPWVKLINSFIPLYYSYLEECSENNTPNNLNYISNNLLSYLVNESMKLKDIFGFDDFGSRKIVNIASQIRKSIYEIEQNSIDYAEDLDFQYSSYYDPNNENFLRLNQIYSKLVSLAK